MIVKDWMTTEPMTVSDSTPLIEAYRILHEYEFRHLPVTRDGRLVGIISNRDVGERVLERVDRGELPVAGTVGEVMTREVYTATPATKLEDAALLLHNQKISALPVVDPDHRLVGILTTNDLLEALAAVLTTAGRGAVFVAR
jgi:acetoin utilization protein AcuB